MLAGLGLKTPQVTPNGLKSATSSIKGPLKYIISAQPSECVHLLPERLEPLILKDLLLDNIRIILSLLSLVPVGPKSSLFSPALQP